MSLSEVFRISDTISTNKEAYSLALAGAAHGTVVIANQQSGGRGRLGKTWQSPAGKGLYCSYVLRPQLVPQKYPQLTFVAGLAAIEAIRVATGLVAGLKWPNDIYFEQRKCGGILTEASAQSEAGAERFAVVGIGLNINTDRKDFPQELRDSATSLYLESGGLQEKEDVFSALSEALFRQLASLEQDGFMHIIRRWRRHDCMQGKRMRWLSVSQEVVEGISLGVDDEGLLYVRDDDGREHQILSGDVFLNQ